MIVEKLGRGKYSEVHKIISYKDGTPYALKIIPKDGLSEEEKEILYNECRIMEVLRHDNIIKFVEAVETPENY